MGFPDSSVGKESTCNAGDPGSIAALWRSPGKGIGYPLQYSGLENSMDCIVHGVAKSQGVCVCVCVKSLSHVWLFVTPWTVAYQAPPSIGFSKQEYWSGLPF